jgi:2-phospho-L-lactate/phosphoenolpyruvate guanylyltransferase
MHSPQRRPMWTLIVPVKQITLAKSRLSGIDDDTRRALAIAFARDTVAAAAASSMVVQMVVVSNDPVAADIAADVARLIPDVPDAGLNPALEYAVRQVRAERASAAVVAVSSDLPALRGDDLDIALARGPATTPWFVPDAQGVGTTLLAAPTRMPWSPSFGPESRRAHREAGFAEIDLAGLERLRRDVDTASDLADARRLGVGPATAAVLAGLEPSPLA